MDVMRVLTKIVQMGDQKEERSEVAWLRKSMENFSFIFLMVIQTKVLKSANKGSKILQQTDTDFETCNVIL